MPTTGTRPTLLFHLYRLATRALVPIAWAVVSRKLARHGVEPARMHERLGHASLPHPAARPIWFHAASVGESLSVLALIARLGERLPGAQFLITSGTATSAALIAKRLPPRCQHQFAPIDAPGPVGRFLDHWRPLAGIFVESEVWPVTLSATRATGARLALVNARLSDRSLRGWRRRPATARYLFGLFDLIVTQNRTIADDLLSIGADPNRMIAGSNLKAAATAPPVDPETFADSRDRLGTRPTWVASSTHPGEEDIALDAHIRLLKTRPDLCLILIPRHPDRGDAVAALVLGKGLTCAQRSRGEAPEPATQVYLADTLGETGTWYALSPLVFLGATLVPKGGHNPFEPALSGCAIAAGPHRENAADAFAGLAAAGGLATVTDAAGLSRQIGLWLDDPQAMGATRTAARTHVETLDTALDDIAARLCAALHLGPDLDSAGA
jgi:3-deoxy-D-manno-octulosonic-acid transferase